VSELLVSRRDRVAVVTWDRPQHGNRLTTALANEVAATLEAARSDEGIAACVLTGTGDTFCLGGDYEGATPTATTRAAYANALLRMDRAMARLGKPLIAAVNGHAHAGGFATVVACDLAIAADDATFGLPEAAKGLFPFVALAIVKDVLPKKLFFDLAYSARLMGAKEARACHLINEAVPRSKVLDRAIECGRQTAAYAGRIVTLGRDLYYESRGLPADEALEAARRALLAALAITTERG
jgi:enoyl-CoA hydratase/carnithine racemase